MMDYHSSVAPDNRYCYIKKYELNSKLSSQNSNVEKNEFNIPTF